MTKRLTHLDETGAARMVDVSKKEETQREAVAEAFVHMQPDTVALLAQGSPKGDVIAVARVAGIAATKRTGELIPLCHPISITHAAVDFSQEDTGVRITSTVRCIGRTGVEMEALTAASVAALAIYDLLKATEKGMTFDVALVSKRGGKSGPWKREVG